MDDTTSPSTMSSGRHALYRNLVLQASSAALPIAVVLLATYLSINSPAFLSWENIVNISVQVATLMTIAVPSAFLLMAGKVDLSVGSLLALSGVVAGLSFPHFGIPLSIGLALAIGALVGLTNGILISAMGMSPIIVTLGGLTLWRGIAQWLSPNPLFGFPEAFSSMGYTLHFGLPVLTWIMLTVLLLGMAVMRFSTVGRHAIAIGVNARAAFLVGIRVRLVTILLYVAVGMAAALAGLMSIARIDSAPSGSLGVGMELNVLTAVLLGGVPFTGGKGSLARVALGVILLGMLSNGLILMNVRTEVGLMITGLVLVLAAGLHLLKRR